MVLSRYFTNDDLVAHMKNFSQRCSAISKLHLIGYSVRKFPLYVLEISSRPGVEEAKPNFKYIANMHGTETGGRQLLLGLAEWLCANYKTQPVARRIVSGMHLWLMPTMNPDGYADQTYENANDVNLNRDFPDPIRNPSMVPTGLEQPETKAVMAWVQSRQFVASANMHEGAVVVNYPWDGTASDRNVYNATQDDATFRHLATVYAQRNPQMHNNPEFPGPLSITNGADWYVIHGGMQDWNYVKAGCFEVTLELWNIKGAANLTKLFNNNLDSMTAYALTSTFGGLRGTVKQRSTGKPLVATITVDNSTFITRSSKAFGDFYRPLAPGKHNVTVALPGVRRASSVQTFTVTVPPSGAGAQLAVTFP